MTTYSHINPSKQKSGSGEPPDDWRMRMEISIEGLKSRQEQNADKTDELILETRQIKHTLSDVNNTTLKLAGQSHATMVQMSEMKEYIKELRSDLKETSMKSGSFDVSSLEIRVKDKEKQLDEAKEKLKHYTRYVIGTLVGIGVAVAVPHLIQLFSH